MCFPIALLNFSPSISQVSLMRNLKRHHFVLKWSSELTSLPPIWAGFCFE